MDIVVKLEREINDIIEEKRDRKGEQVKLKPYESAHVREIARGIRDGRITEEKKFIIELKKIGTIKEFFSDKDYRDLVDEIEEDFKKEDPADKNEKKGTQEIQKKKSSWFF